MQIEFIGAAQTVTASMHLVHTKHARTLLDCGVFQGRRHEPIEKNRKLAVDVSCLDAIVASHAQMSHSGALPFLARGIDAPVDATRAMSER
jgi:metallo-beta-lactamase family protein